MSGRYRVVVVLGVGITAGAIIAVSPWWVSILIGAIIGIFADNLARWIGSVEP